VNQELEQYLRLFIDHRQEQWPEWLGIAEFAYNNKVHLSTQTIPFKALLDSQATGMFMDKNTAEKYGFRLQKLERLLIVRNVDGTGNSRGNITHQVEINVFYKNHVERMRVNICNLGRTEVILGMLWLQAYNPEINWEIGEVKITRCLPLCRRNLAVKGNIK